MNRIMDDIADLTEGTSFQSYKYSFDSVRTPEPSYDENPDGYRLVWDKNGETHPSGKPVNLYEYASQLKKLSVEVGTEPYIRFFLDGSRHVYHVDDVSYGSRVFPVVAGQVGVACCRRDAGHMSVEHPIITKRVISLPDLGFKDEWEREAKINYVRDKINENERLQTFSSRLGVSLRFDDILTYSTDERQKGDFKNRGIASVQDYMIDAEKGLVDTLARSDKLKNNAYLLKDGSIEYVPMKTGRYADIKAFLDSYRWVIGVSKSFNPELCQISVGRGKTKPNAKAIIKLRQYERTPVARVSIDRIPDIEFAVWYVRLRTLQQTKTPYDGVIKVEKILVTDTEKKDGIKTEDVDNISATLINERIPTCYGSDLRYANHLYPVYLTESYVKSTYMSTEMFLNLF